MGQQKKRSSEQVFDELSKKKEKIDEAAFVKKIQTLKDAPITLEQAKLLCRRIENGGISKRQFLNYVQFYYAVVKDTALTDGFDVAAAKVIRKLEKGELLEVLEGPTKDDKLGMSRVKTKALLDGEEGWATVSGNQGTVFLQKADKPYYTCLKCVDLRSDISGGDDIRILKEDE